MGTSVEDGFRESSRPELWAVCGFQRPIDHRAARTRHPDTIAIDAAVEIAAVLVLLEEDLERVEERHERECSAIR
jgi:hypothetical protein